MLFGARPRPSGEPTDLELLLRTHRGHEPSARLLWDRHAPRLLAIASRLCAGTGGEATAHDVVQSVFVAILATPRSRLSEVRDVPAYLARGVRNAAMNTARSRSRFEHHLRELAASTAPSGGVLQAAGAPILDAMQRLDPDHRELLVLKHGGGLTFDQIALALEQSRSTVAGRYAAAVERLRGMLNEQGGTR
jgi:RNA polymerase sigma-70 factor (ECF subfamily)